MNEENGGYRNDGDGSSSSSDDDKIMTTAISHLPPSLLSQPVVGSLDSIQQICKLAAVAVLSYPISLNKSHNGRNWNPRTSRMLFIFSLIQIQGC